MAYSTELCIGQMQKKNGTVAPDCNEPAYNESVDTANFPISFTWPLVRGLPLYNEPDVPPQSQYFWHRFLCTHGGARKCKGMCHLNYTTLTTRHKTALGDCCSC